MRAAVCEHRAAARTHRLRRDGLRGERVRRVVRAFRHLGRRGTLDARSGRGAGGRLRGAVRASRTSAHPARDSDRGQHDPGDASGLERNTDADSLRLAALRWGVVCRDPGRDRAHPRACPARGRPHSALRGDCDDLGRAGGDELASGSRSPLGRSRVARAWSRAAWSCRLRRSAQRSEGEGLRMGESESAAGGGARGVRADEPRLRPSS